MHYQNKDLSLIKTRIYVLDQSKDYEDCSKHRGSGSKNFLFLVEGCQASIGNNDAHKLQLGTKT